MAGKISALDLTVATQDKLKRAEEEARFTESLMKAREKFDQASKLEMLAQQAEMLKLQSEMLKNQQHTHYGVQTGRITSNIPWNTTRNATLVSGVISSGASQTFSEPRDRHRARRDVLSACVTDIRSAAAIVKIMNTEGWFSHERHMHVNTPAFDTLRNELGKPDHTSIRIDEVLFIRKP